MKKILPLLVILTLYFNLHHQKIFTNWSEITKWSIAPIAYPYIPCYPTWNGKGYLAEVIPSLTPKDFTAYFCVDNKSYH